MRDQRKEYNTNVNERRVKISVVIPAYQAETMLPACLKAIRMSSKVPYEIIVVNDCSMDRTAEIAQQSGARVLNTKEQSGSAAARNLGARNASDDILLFIDSDIVIQPGTIDLVETIFESGNCDAVFGSYDDDPAEQNFVSQYKNLQHHYVHQSADTNAETFWSGCGAIRRDVFLAMNGFDEIKYRHSSIEDIELGYRLKADGYHVVLCKEMMVKHLKRWTFRSHLKTEILHRAVPWAELIMSSRKMIQDLNLSIVQRVSAVLVYVAAVSAVLAAVHYFFIFPALFCVAGVLFLNRNLYVFFWKRRGFGFALRTVPMHFLYYGYSAAAFGICWANHAFHRIRSVFATP